MNFEKSDIHKKSIEFTTIKAHEATESKPWTKSLPENTKQTKYLYCLYTNIFGLHMKIYDKFYNF